MGSGQDAVSSATKTAKQAPGEATQALPPVVDTAKEAASSVTTTAKQELHNATQTAKPAVDTAKEVASSVTKTAKQTLGEATQALPPAVDTAKEVASSVTKTAKQELRNATQTAKPAVDTAKNVASSLPRTAKEEPHRATQPLPEAEGAETDGLTPAVRPEIGEATEEAASGSDSEGRRAGARSTARTDDSLRPTHRRATGTETDRAHVSAAPTSVKGSSAVGTPLLKADAIRQVRGTNTRRSHSGTVHRGRALVPPLSRRPHADPVAAERSSTASGAQPPSSRSAANSGRFSFVLPGFSWPSFLPEPLVLAQWLLYAATALLGCIAVLLASGFWAKHRVLKF